MTNKEKFLRTFDIDPDELMSPGICSICKFRKYKSPLSSNCSQCADNWWNADYKKHKQATWRRTDNGRVCCSKCGYEAGEFTQYCPNCSAYMGLE